MRTGKRMWQKGLAFFLATLFIVSSFGQSGLDANTALAASTGAPKIRVAFDSDASGGTGVKAGEGLYLLGNGEANYMQMAVRFVPGYTTGYVTGASITLQLPYLYYNSENQLMMSYTKPKNVAAEDLMGIEAKSAGDDNWTDERVDLDANSSYDSETGYHRGSIVLKTAADTVQVGPTAISFDFVIRFYGDVPENASAQIALGGAYSTYYDGRGNQSDDGYVIIPGTSSEGEEETGDLRLINMVNSNLVWNPEIEMVHTSVLWDKYNYMVYRVKLENESLDKASIIDHFTLNMSIQSTARDPSRGGVIERDMMQWERTEDGQIVKNDDQSDAARGKDFIGVPNEGGALVYDITDMSDADRAKVDFETFQNLPAPMAYNYASPGILGVQVKGEDGRLVPAEAAVNGKHSFREYYIAIPYPNNFQGRLDNTSTLMPTIFFGGRDLAWSKTTGAYQSDFIRKKYEFNHQKYLLSDGEEPQRVGQKDAPIGSEQAYYLDGFDNTGNVPVFNAVATDTLPDDFELTRVALTLNKDGENAPPPLSTWMKTVGEGDETPDFLTLVFVDKDGGETLVSPAALGITAVEKEEENGDITWTYDAHEAVQKYLAQQEHEGWSLKKLRFAFCERIEREMKFPGVIAVSGNVNHLRTYLNALDTAYEHWYYRLATADLEEGYEVEHKTVERQQAELNMLRADPQVEGHGVFRGTDQDGSPKETVSEGDEPMDVPVSEDMSSLRFLLANGSSSQMLPGYLKIGPLFYETEDENGKKTEHSFEATGLRLSAGLCDKSKIESIVLTDRDGVQRVVEIGELSENENGEIFIEAKFWQEYEELPLGVLDTVEINFKRFDGDVSYDDGAFVDVLGIPGQMGEYKAEASFETRYDMPDVEEDIAADTALLNVLRIDPVITGAAHYNDQAAKVLTVPNKVSAWYEFIVENRSRSAAGHVNLDIDLQSVGNKNTALLSDPVVKGFAADSVVLGNYQQSGIIERIEFFDWFQNPETAEPLAVIPFDDAKRDFAREDGSIVIPSYAFGALERVKVIRIVYKKFEREVQADKENPENDTALRVEVHGLTDWFDELKAETSFVPLDDIYTENDIVKDDCTLLVPRPEMMVHAHIQYDDVKESVQQNINTNSDKNQTILGIPYDRDFLFRTEILNESLSVLDDVDFTLQAPIENNEGFHLTAIDIYKDLVDQFEHFETVALYDAADSVSPKAVLRYDPSAGAMAFEGKSYPFVDGHLVLTADTLREELGVESFSKMTLTGKQAEVAVRDDDTKRRWIDLHGYSDGNFGTNQTLLADTVNHLDNFRDIEAYRIKAHDTSVCYMSKMYFDTVVTAGYNDNHPGVKFDKVSTPLEHVRDYHRPGGVYGFEDNSELEIGYKALGSYLVDFRQYLNTGASLPANRWGYSSQEHQNMPWVRPQSLNTAADVDIQVALPSASFESYYLKVDPRARDYLNSVTVTRKDGTAYRIERETLLENFESGVEQSADGEKFCRINLLKGDESTLFSQNEGDYYRAPKDYDAAAPQNPVTGVTINISINQKQNTVTDGEAKANNPDFGTWYKETDESTKYMFEIGGRFYRMQDAPNENGQAKATATASMSVGGGRSKARASSGATAPKSGWSFVNKYYPYDYYGNRMAEQQYTAGHLKSTTSVHVVRDFDRIMKGVTTNPTQDYDYQAEFAGDEKFLVSFFRESRADQFNFYTPYETTGNLTGKWYDEDADDWAGKIGYGDEAILRDTLPTIRPNPDTNYYGFLTNGLELLPTIGKYFDSVDLTFATVDKDGNRTGTVKVTVTRDQLVTNEEGNLALAFQYPEIEEPKPDNGEEPGGEPGESSSAPGEGEDGKEEDTPTPPQPAPALSNGVFRMNKDQFVLAYDLHLKDMMGNGEYNKEVGQKGAADKNGGAGAADLIVHGSPYTVYQKDPLIDGTNTMQPFTKVDYENGTYTNLLDKSYGAKNYDTACMMGYTISFKMGQQLVLQGNRNITDYHADNITPTVAEFGVKAYNQSVEPTDANEHLTGKYAIARAKNAKLTNSMNALYRLQHIYIPKEFIDGDWFRATSLKLSVNGTTKTVALKAAELKDSVKHPDCYEVDVEELLRQNAAALVSTYQNSTTDGVTFSKAYVSSFELLFEAVKPDRKDGSTVLCNKQYLSPTRGDGYAYYYDGVYVDRTMEDFLNDEWNEDSTPSFGKNPNHFSPYVNTSTQNYTYIQNSLSAYYVSADPNADIYPYSKVQLMGSVNENSFSVTNRVATLIASLTRDRAAGGGKGFAYDNDQNPGSRLEVDKDHLLPYDYIEYTFGVSDKDDAGLPLARPTMHFMVPAGQRLVKWEIVENTTGIDSSDIIAAMGDGAATPRAFDAAAGVDYSLNADGGENYWRTLQIKVGADGARIPIGKGVKIRITTQLTDELKDSAGSPAFEGKTLTANAWVTADNTHAYPQYCVDRRDVVSSTGKYTPAADYSDLGTDTDHPLTYSRNYAVTNGKQVYEARVVSSVTFKNTANVAIAYSFDDKGYAYDDQGAKLTVSSIKNDTRHYSNELTVTVSFLDKNGYRGFELTKTPVITYPEKLPENPGRKAVKIEYLPEGSEDWVESTGHESEEFLRSVQQIRWTYYDVNALGADNAELIFQNVELIGVGRYEDIRKQSDTGAMAEIYNAANTGAIVHKHDNVEEKTVGDEGAAVIQESTVKLSEQKLYNQNVYRENPQLKFFTQVFEKQEQAAADYNEAAAQKTGYRPNEEMWQKITLINQHTVDAAGAQNADQGALINPVFYDKLPEYLTSADLDAENFHIRWKDIDGNVLLDTENAVNPQNVSLKAAAARKVRANDFGGDMVYPKSTLNTAADTNSKKFNDLKPSAQNSTEIEFTVYELRFEKAGGGDVRVEVGDTVEIWYRLKAREDDLPMVYVDESKDEENDLHPAYFPRAGEYYSYTEDYNRDGQAWPFAASGSDGARAVQNSGRMMDMDYLLHDIGVSGEKNEQVDRWEYLSGSSAMIPGTAANNPASGTYPNMYGNNGVLIDEDASVLNNRQMAQYIATRSGNKNAGLLPDGAQMLIGGQNRDWYRFVVALRAAFAQDFDGNAETDTQLPILWSETRLHLQKAWLLTSSQMISAEGNRQYQPTSGDGLTDGYAANPNYSMNRKEYSWETTENNYHSLTDDSSIVALEYNEDFTARLSALNYGDWGLDGVEMTYTFPRGVRPKLGADGRFDASSIKAYMLGKVNGPASETYQPIDASDLEITVLQSPEGGYAGYRAPRAAQDPLLNSDADSDSSYYPVGGDAVGTQPWVLKITVKTPLKKWFNRGAGAGYKLYVDIPSNIYDNNGNGMWYDRLITRPWVNGNSQNHYDYQIFDIDHWEGATRTKMQHNQLYGMDYMWYDDYNNAYEYNNGSPNTPYIDGYNIQNDEVIVPEGDSMGGCTDNAYGGYAKADRLDLYAATGTRAVERKPLVRMWTTAGDDLTGATRRDYYTDTEGQKNKINVHVENKYWLDAYSPDGGNSNYNYDYIRFVHNYEVDGGSRGTLILPVVTVILPYGIAPVAADGTLFTRDNTQNAGKTVDWTLFNSDGSAALAGEQDKYNAAARYELISASDETGAATGGQEGRYVVTFTPKSKADGGDKALEARIKSGGANIFSFETFTYALPKAAVKGGENNDLYRNYENVRTFVTSRMEDFKFLVDEDIKNAPAGQADTKGNPYKVGAPAQNRYQTDAYAPNKMPDARLDAEQAVYSYLVRVSSQETRTVNYTRGNVPKDRLSHSLEQQAPFFGPMKKYQEASVCNVEDYTADKDGNPLRDALYLSEDARDFNQNGGHTHQDYLTTEAFKDAGVTATMKLRTSAPRLSVEHFVSENKEDEGRKLGEEMSIPTFEYSDVVWYGAKLANAPSSSDNYFESGAVQHSKLVFSFHLPKAVRFFGTAGWNVENNDGDRYNNADDIAVEYTDAKTGETVLLTQKELREQGWGFEVTADSSEDWDEDEKEHPSQTVVIELTTPKSEHFSDYQSFVDGERPAGYLASGSIVNLKIKTRVDNGETEGLRTSPDVWSGYKSDVYVATHDGDGRYALAANGTFAKPGEQGTVDIPAESYNGYAIQNGYIDGGGFADQVADSFYWNTAQSVSDALDEESGALVTDWDLDGEFEEHHVTNQSATIKLQKPAGTVRLDTGKPRYRINDPSAERYVMEDPHIRSAYTMAIRMTQAVNEAAALNTFIVNYTVPYFGTNFGTSGPADPMTAKPMAQTVHRISTGAWELPEDAGIDEAARKVLGEHLKVTLYVLPKDDPRAETGYYYPGDNDSADWRIVGNPDGYGLTENAVVDIANDYPELMNNVYQIRWVIKTEAFTNAEGVSFDEEQAPIYYPVPAALRMDVDADGDPENGKQEMDEIDPERRNIEVPADNVVQNSPFVEFNTSPFLGDDGVNKHVNNFGTIFPRYDDQKHGQISERARAGYYVDPEVPVVDIYIGTLYFSGGAIKGYTWNDNVIVDGTSSNMIKYKVSYQSVKNDDIEADNATNPNIAVALPYIEKLNQNSFNYIEFQEPDEEGNYKGDYYIGDAFGGEDYKQNLDKKVPLWTWYVVNEDGSVALPGSKDNHLTLTEASPAFVQKPINSTDTNRKIVNYYFEGKLYAGQTVMVEMMVPIEEADGNAVPTDMLECKAYGFKKGNFTPYIENSESGFGSIGYEYDSADINQNGNVKDQSVTRSSSAIAFKTTASIVQNKSVQTELTTYETKVAAAVNEGGDYTFKTSMINKGTTPYNDIILYDVLPEVGDTEIMNTLDGEDIPRNSQWHGWLRPDSIKLSEYHPATASDAGYSTEFDPAQYDLWVGPIVRENGKFTLKDTSILPDRAAMQKKETYSALRSSDSEKAKYFVRLSDLMQNTAGAEREALIKGIRAIWVQIKDEDYKIVGQARVELSYTMHEPVNVPKFVGTPVLKTEEESQDPVADFNDTVKDFAQWNTFVSHWSGGQLENAKSGVFVNAPSGRGYIGSYVFEDADYSKTPDSGEGDFGTVGDTGRPSLKNKTTDLDFDGENDDPGINGALVELLTTNGYPCNRDGVPVRQVETQTENGETVLKYAVVDEATGGLVTDPTTGLHSYSPYGPVRFVTESDYYGNAGYYMLSNLKPGEYNLKITMPEGYSQYSVTTTALGETETPLAVYRNGEEVYNGLGAGSGAQVRDIPADRLTVQTVSPITVEAVDEDALTHGAYDKKMTSYNLGVGRAYTYGGYTWLDETEKTEPDGTVKILSDGYFQQSEQTLSGIEVSIYNIKDLENPCLDGDGNKAVYTVEDGDNGYFEFRLKPGEKYIAVARDVKDGIDRILKPTPWTFETDPLKAGDDNDLSKVSGRFETKAFTPAIPFDESGKALFEDDGQRFLKNKNLGLGLINAGRGFLGKFVWDDQNYDGIQDKDEPGIPGVTVTLESYYFDPARPDGEQWVKFQNDRKLTTNDAGAYVFDNVLSWHTPVEGGKKYLTGYKLRIDPNDNQGVYGTYGITHLYSGGGVADSDLLFDDHTLNREMVIIAVEATDDTPAQTRVTYGGKDYDLGDAEILLDYDAGLVRYEYAEVDGIVWNDNGAAEGHTYNGVMDEDENGVQIVKVTLEQYYKDADGLHKITADTGAVGPDGAAQIGETTTLTNAQGAYHFEGLPAFVDIGGERYLCYYRIKAQLPSSAWAVTRYRQPVEAGGVNSHWITDEYEAQNENYLTSPDDGDYFMVARPVETGGNPPYTLTDGGEKYDIITNQENHSGYDGGLVGYPDGAFTGLVWEDKNYDGVRGDGEPGRDGVSVKLSRYYFDGSQWVKDLAFADKTAVTKNGGVYEFNGLDTEVIVDGRAYLAGYKPSLASLPSDCGVTRYRQGGDRSLDNDLIAQDLSLSRAGEILPTSAIAAPNADGSYHSTTVEVTDIDGVTARYDMLTARTVSGYDAGLVVYPDGKLTGLVWNDKNYDGMRGEGEEGIVDVPVTLLRYYYDGADWRKDDSFAAKTAVTDAAGVYTFKDLPTRVVVDGKSYLAGYRVSLAKRPFGWGVTRYFKGDDRTLDSDLIAENLSLNRDGEYIPAAAAAKPNTPGEEDYNDSAVAFTDVDGDDVIYDMLTARTAETYDAGLVLFPDGELSGIAWDDKNYDGVRGADEELLSGVKVELFRYYYNGTDWVKDTAFTTRGTTTNDDGVYYYDKLDTQVEIDGKFYLAGYTVGLKELPKDYAVTKYWRGEDRTTDSNLRSSDLMLNRPGEYIVVAGAPDEDADLNPSTLITYTDIDGVEHTRDLLEKTAVDGFDAGLSKLAGGTVSGVIWDDKNYDGVRGVEEPGLSDVTVTIERFVKRDDVWEKDNAFAYSDDGNSVNTDTGGGYLFDGLATYTTENDQKLLYGYRVTVEKDSIPEGYAVTRYQQGGDAALDSDLIEATGALTTSGETLIVAKPAKEDDHNPDYTIDGYDVVKGDVVSGHDGGLVSYQKAEISGLVWKDKNYDGIRQDGEPGVKGVKVTLARWYQKDGVWTLDADFTAPETVTGETGAYSFKNLPTFVEKDDVLYLCGYRLQVDAETLPEGFAVTRYRQGEDETLDSDLIADTGKLCADGETIVLAVKNSEALAGNAHNVRDGYDIVLARDETTYDGGLTEIQTGAIEGVLWNDQNYDGMRGEEEPGIENVKVLLDRYLMIDGAWALDESFTALESVTDATGAYAFSKLPTTVTVDNVTYLVGYAPRVDAVEEKWAVTRYQQGEDRALDSDLIAETLRLTKDGEILTVAKVATTGTDDEYNHTVVTGLSPDGEEVLYDTVLGRTVTGYDGGLTEIQTGSIMGVLWNDQNYDGMRGEDEPGIENVKVLLERYLFKDGEWTLDESFMALESVTDATGAYAFSELPTTTAIDGVTYLVGYAPRVDAVEEKWAVTRYQQGGDRELDSDLIAANLRLTKDGEILTVAQKATPGTDGTFNYSVMAGLSPDGTLTIYDTVLARTVIGYDGGLTEIQTGAIEGVLWNDHSYDGVRGDDETGVEGVKVLLDRYLFKNGEWVLDESFTAPQSVTDETGAYVFSELPTTVTIDDVTYLVGYAPRVEAIDEKWSVGKYQQGEDKALDSDLVASNLHLTSEGQVLTIAKVAQPGADGAYNHTVMTGLSPDGEETRYDTVLAETVTGYDGGLTLFENGALEGTLWLDENEDGLLDEGEPRVGRQEVTLTQYQKVDGEWVQVEGFERTQRTGEDGCYRFEDLPLFAVTDENDGEPQRVLLGYRLHLTALPDDTEATKYLQNNGIDDSKLKAELMNLTESAFEEQGTLVPSDRADETVNPYYTIDGYDTVKPRQLHQMNAGFVKRLLEDPWGVETGDRGLTLWWLLPLSAAVLVLLLTVRRRARA